MSFLYFAYGSNMNAERIHINCPSAKQKCIAKLKGFKLTFKGYADGWKGAVATIDESVNDNVWGIVWEISKDEEARLDKQEAGYKAITVKVEDSNGCNILCKSYQKLSTGEKISSECNLPSAVYKTVIIHGAKEFQLPSCYIELLEMLEDNGYHGDVSALTKQIIKND